MPKCVTFPISFSNTSRLYSYYCLMYNQKS